MTKTTIIIGTAILASIVIAGNVTAAAGETWMGGCRNSTGSDLKSCVIGRASISGDYATTIATGRATRPSSVSVLIYTSTPQPVDINWTIVCLKGYGAGSKSGHRRMTTFRESLTPTGIHKPWTMTPVRFPMARPDSCTVSAGGQLSRSGSLIVQIVAVRR